METNQQYQVDIERQVAEFRTVRPRYKQFARFLEDVLKEVSKSLAPLAIVQTRAKKIPSFASKIIRKSKKDPVRDFTDLCGARVITHLPSEVEAICRFIENHFNIDEENSVDISQRRKPAEFGYRSVHYIVQMKPGKFIYEGQSLDSIDNDLLPSDDVPMKAEIQVRTLLEHSWADFSHDRIYKSVFKVPDCWEHEMAALAAMIESVDQAFERIKDSLTIYQSSYNYHISKEMIANAIARDEKIYTYDQNNKELALNIAMYALELEDWTKVITVLQPFSTSGHVPIMRTLGIAMCKQFKTTPESKEYQQGRQLLEFARAEKDVDAISSLAGTYKKTDARKAHALYKEAYLLDPSDPYPLMNFLQYEVIEMQSIAMISLLKPIIDSAIDRCNTQIEVGVNLPWAHYIVGFLKLMLNEPNAAIKAYAKAVATSNPDWMIETSYDSLAMFEEPHLASVKEALIAFDSVKLLLELSLHARSISRASKEAESDTAIHMRESLQADMSYGLISKPVVIFVGGCDSAVESAINKYKDVLLDAFSSYQGTIIGGGTKAGVSGLAATIQRAYSDTIKSIGYLPESVPADVQIDEEGYNELRTTKTSNFSILDCLHYWIDLLASDIKPSEVKVIGINGGEIAAAEFEIALALGAQVGILQGSGRAADLLLANNNLSEVTNLCALTVTAESFKAFLTT